jgi:acetyl esterase/lipase
LAAVKTFIFRALCVVVFLASFCAAEDVIPLYPGIAPGSTPESYPEKAYFSKVWNTDVVTNVTKPTLTVFKPTAELKNRTAVVICPGGGFMALSITSEGYDVAKYLAAKGVTAFVLKYRLAHTGEDATQEFVTLLADGPKFGEMFKRVEPLAVADGLAAVTYVRQHAAEWGVSPDRVGIIGFSAGGTVTSGVAFQYAAEGRPAFVAPIYPAAAMFKDAAVPADAPPMFIAAATDDQLGLRRTAWLYTRSGRARRSQLSCICMRKAATASECVRTASPPIIGSTGSPTGWRCRGG